MSAHWMIFAGGLVFFILGALHLLYSFLDLKDPRHFVPATPGLLVELQKTHIKLRKDAKDFWSSSLGFHFSHSVGVIFFAFVVMYCAVIRPDIMADVFVRVVIVIVAASYVLMARAFWFIIPLVGAGIGVFLIAVGMALLYPYG